MRKITTNTHEFSYSTNRILKVILFKNTKKTFSPFVERAEISKQLTKGEKHFVLVDARANINSLKDVLSFSVKKNETEKSIARAYIVKSFANKVIGNAFLSLRKTTIPTRLFSNEKEATSWFDNMIYLTEMNNHKMFRKAFV